MAIHGTDERLGNAVNDEIDVAEFARLAAEVVAMIEHHRDELRVAMAELTALQRTVRSEIRDAVHQLDRIAAGLPATDSGPGPAEPTEHTSGAGGRRRGKRA